MNVTDLLVMVTNQLRDVVGESDEYLWADEEIIDIYANDARNKLFANVNKYGADLLIDDSTVDDGATVPLPICQIDLVAGTAKYQLSECIIDIKSVHIDGQEYPLGLLRRDLLTSYFPNWRTMTNDTPEYYTPNLETGYIIFTPPPIVDGTAYLTVSRLPIDDLTYIAPTADLGFRREYHMDLLPWILYRCLSKKDIETDRPDQAEMYRQLFDKRCKEIADDIRTRNSNNRVTVPCTMVV